jgi:hypothetical protein
LLDPGLFFSFVILFYAEGRTPWINLSPSQGRYLHTGQHKQNKRTQTSMPLVEIEPTIPVSERAKTVHALDRVVTVIGKILSTDAKCGRVTELYFTPMLPVLQTHMEFVLMSSL